MVWFPPSKVVFKLLLASRLISAFYNLIADCDETFNYWEPLHYVLYGYGFQKWEYSPEFSLRSYFYIGIHAVLVKIASFFMFDVLNAYYFPLFPTVFQFTKLDLFYALRYIFALVFSGCETFFYRSLALKFGDQSFVPIFYLLLSLFSTGMFISGTSFLPSSFCMYFILH
eukprot:Sdes_comp19445_c0_seq1m10848